MVIFLFARNYEGEADWTTILRSSISIIIFNKSFFFFDKEFLTKVSILVGSILNFIVK